MKEVESLLSQNVIPSRRSLGGAKSLAFTEQGIAMLSSVLTSERAVEVNISIISDLCEAASTAGYPRGLGTPAGPARVAAVEQEGRVHYIFETIQQLMEGPEIEPKRRIGSPTSEAGPSSKG